MLSTIRKHAAIRMILNLKSWTKLKNKHCITLNKTIMGKKAEQAEKIAKSVVKVAGIVATVGGVILKTVADNKK